MPMGTWGMAHGDSGGRQVKVIHHIPMTFITKGLHILRPSFTKHLLNFPQQHRTCNAGEFQKSPLLKEQVGSCSCSGV